MKASELRAILNDVPDDAEVCTVETVDGKSAAKSIETVLWHRFESDIKADENAARPKFDADKAEEYFTQLRDRYKKMALERFNKDNEERDSCNPWYSAEYHAAQGKITAMDAVLEYFSRFDF